jgi:hypothetical protein
VASAAELPPGPRHRFAILAGLVVLALVLRAPLLGRSVWFDEACMSHQRIGSWAQLVATLYVDIHPPLFVTFMHCWNGLFGDSALSMRLPALLCGLASIPAMWWTGRLLVGDAAALVAAALLAGSPVHIWYSAEARLYSPMLLCALLAVGCQVRLVAGAGGRRLWLLHWANVLVMLSLHYYLAVYVVLLAALAPVAARGFGRPVHRILTGHGLGLVLLGGFVAAKMALGQFEESQGYMRDLDAPELFRFVFDWCFTGNCLPAFAAWSPGLARMLVVAGQVLCGLLLLCGCGELLAHRRTRPRGLLLPVFALAVPAFLFVLPFTGRHGAYIERSAIAALPFVLLVVGAGVVACRGVVRWAVAAPLAALVAASVFALFRFDDQWTVYKPNPDWRSAAAYLGREIDAGAAGRPVFTSKPNPRSLVYYDARIQDVKNLLPAAEPQAIGAKVGRRFGGFAGDLAERTFRQFEAEKAALLAGAALRVYRAGNGTVESLDLPTKDKDGVFYLVRNHWHPAPTDRTVEDLAASPRVEVLETCVFAGVTVWKVRLRR